MIEMLMPLSPIYTDFDAAVVLVPPCISSSNMKFANPIYNLCASRNHPLSTGAKNAPVLTAILISLSIVFFCWLVILPNDLRSSKLDAGSSKSVGQVDKRCDVFSGKWAHYQDGTYYTNATCPFIWDQQNCLKFGRPDTEFLNWRWKPDKCDLPRFCPHQFLQIVRGKSMAFVGDSVARNQMQSLLCLLGGVAYSEDISQRYTLDKNFQRWYYSEHNFTIATFWAPFLVKSGDVDPNGRSLDSIMSLYLDEPEHSWASEIENFDYVILSAGQWFFRPLIFHEKHKIVGCCSCKVKNITELTRFHGYRMAFRTAFRALLTRETYTGMTFLRTFSPDHFENGPWNDGGNCPRTRPFVTEEMKFEGNNLEFYSTQVEEFRAAEREAIKRGLKFRLLDTTEVMLMRPDGHPNHYAHSPGWNATMADCVHWCLPGPIDTWNEFLFYVIRSEGGIF